MTNLTVRVSGHSYCNIYMYKLMVEVAEDNKKKEKKGKKGEKRGVVPPFSASWTTGREINGTETCGLARTGWVLP